MSESFDIESPPEAGKQAVPVGAETGGRWAGLMLQGLTALPAPARLVGPDRRVLWANEAMSALTDGVGRGGECSVLRTALCDTPDCPLVRAQQGQDTIQREVTIRPPEEPPRRCLLATSAVRDATGGLQGVLHVYQAPAEVLDDRRVDEVKDRLRERAKELDCFFGITTVVEQAGDDLEAILQGIARLLPRSWRFPTAAEACVTLDGKAYRSQGYRSTPWKLSARVLVTGEPAGQIDVVYNQPCPEADEGPFLAEERRLIDSVAERLGKIVERLRTRRQLAAERQALHESNVALRSVLARVEDGKREVADSLQANIDKIIKPLLATLEAELPASQQRYIELIRENLDDIASPFTDNLSKQFMSLTPSELRVCDMVRQGLASKEIARLLHVSPSTINRHREHIRNKLGLTHRSVNLATYLNSYMTQPR